ncbi:helix-turn-helix domain-containing protein [Nonomuraea sp. NPDC049400]|uniref:helix-turn-helix domain-containing protein n=1 Tax=Nonomuraea sp. NPDC049400 TaxID=3364352 RepID=UPI0037B5CB11
MGTGTSPENSGLSPRRLLGALMQHWRLYRGFSQGDVEKALLINGSNLSKFECGKRIVPAPVITDIDSFYGANGMLVGFHSLVISVDRKTRVSGESDIGHAEGVDMVRRQLLAAIATLGGAAAVLPVEELGNLRHLIDRTAGSTRIDDWEELVWEHAHALKTQPVADVISDIALDVLDLQKILPSVGNTEAGWARVDAQLKFLLARALGLAGQARESRHWWITARHAAEESRDPQLVALCRGWEATHGLYEKRSPTILLARTEDAIEAARGRPCAGVAEALTAQAQVRAIIGDETGAQESLGRQARIFEQLPDEISADTASAFGWPVTRMLHTRSFVATYTDHAEQAQQEALSAYAPSDVRAIAQIKLHQAMAEVATGDVGEGLDMARRAISEVPTGQQTMFTRYSAKMVLQAVPEKLDNRARPTVDAYREMLALPQPSKESI